MLNKSRTLPLTVWLIRLAVLAVLIGSSLDCVRLGKWYELAAGLGGTTALILTWLFFSWLCPGRFCSSLDMAVSLLVCQGVVWGTIYHAYDRLSFYDTATHFGFGIVLAWSGILILFRKTKSQQGTLPFEAGLVVLFGLSFAMFGKVIWEFYEFAGDRLLAADMQRWQEGNLVALTDTMMDLAAGFTGTILVCLPVYWNLRRHPDAWIRHHILPLVRLDKSD